MYLSILSIEQVADIYHEHMKYDFPPDEIKPLQIIVDAINEKRYLCYGIFSDDVIVGYMFIIKLPMREDYLIDYLAVYPEYRNSGVGSCALGLISRQLLHADSIILEVEDPEYAQNDSDRVLQTRRYHFYQRNGFADTGVRAKAFGVPFVLLEIGGAHAHSSEEVAKLYRDHYKSMLPRALYDANIEV